MKSKLSSVFNIFSQLEKIICYTTLTLLVLMPIIELFGVRFMDSRLLLNHLFLILVFFAAMVTTKSNSHISITITQFIKNEKIKKSLETVCTLIAIVILSILVWDCIAYIKTGHFRNLMNFIPEWIFVIVLPLGYAVIIMRLIYKLDSKLSRILGIAAFILGTIIALPALLTIFSGDSTELISKWRDIQASAIGSASTYIIILLILAALSGMPIFVALGGIAIVFLLSLKLPPAVAATEIHFGIKNSDLLALPLFTLVGFFLSESKAGERLVRLFRSLFGWLPGGMIIATVVICTFFTAFTGASGVTIIALGGLLFTILHQYKYKENFSIGLLTSSGGIGLLFPPSLPIILVFATINFYFSMINKNTGHSIMDYFIGALIPGIILVILTVGAGAFVSRNVKIPREKFNFKNAAVALKESFFEIMLPVILILGIFLGWLPLSNIGAIAAVAVVYVFIVEVFIKRDIKLKNVGTVFSKAIPIIGGILAILTMSYILSYAINRLDVMERFAGWMHNTIESKIVFLMLLNLALLVVGCLMDIFSAIMVILPLIIPIGEIYGIDPLHLGIIFLVNLEAGFLTPPVGMNLFLATYRFEKPFAKICRYVTPFLLVRLAVLIIVTYIPFVTTWHLPAKTVSMEITVDEIIIEPNRYFDEDYFTVEVTAKRGETIQFTATVTGENNPSQEVTWYILYDLDSTTNIDEYGLLTICPEETETEIIIVCESKVPGFQNVRSYVDVFIDEY